MPYVHGGSSKMEKAILIQARISSKRFPGKVLHKLNGQTLLDHIIDVCTLTELPIFLCIPLNDEKLFTYFKENLQKRVILFRGSEYDVLDRFYQCAKQHEIKVIIRICADNPLLQFDDIEVQIELFRSRNFSYGNNVWIFSFGELERTWNEATHLEEREHLCNYMMKSINYPEDMKRFA